MCATALFVPAVLTISLILTMILPSDLAAQDPQWFSKHISKDGRYYEGLFDQPNAMAAYEIIGFFACVGSAKDMLAAPLKPESSPPMKRESSLHVWFYLPPTRDPKHPTPKAVRIRVKQIASRTNYLMQSTPKGIQPQADRWNNFAWNTDAIISRYNINIKKLGVLARIDPDDANKDEITPVVFCLQCPANGEINHYELVLKVQHYSLADLSYEVHTQSQPSAAVCYFTVTEPCLPSRPTSTPPIEVGTVLKLPFNIDAPPGWVNLQIRGHYKDSSEQLKLTYSFFHQPTFSSAP